MCLGQLTASARLAGGALAGLNLQWLSNWTAGTLNMLSFLLYHHPSLAGLCLDSGVMCLIDPSYELEKASAGQ